jgi:hypothetical protein
MAVILIATLVKTSSTTCLLSSSTDCPCGAFDNANVCCYKIEEDIPAGYVFGSVADQPSNTSENLNQILNSGKVITFSEEPLDPGVNVSQNGTYYTQKRLDREGSIDNCFLVTITVSTSESTTNFQIAYVILDINDNPPVFQTNPVGLSTYNTSITERELSDNPASNKLLCSTPFPAIDNDEGPNGTVSYTILSPVGDFAIDSDQGVVCLVTLITIDREKNQTLTIVVEASDNGAPTRKSSTLTIHITVLDSNDNDPMFIGGQQNPMVLENATIGTVVATYVATDIDVGSNAIIEYSLTMEPPFFPFILVNNAIYVNGTLDADVGPTSFTFTISVRNPGNPIYSDSISDTITIVNINDIPPGLTIVPDSFSIVEGNQTNSNVQSIFASDTESCSNCVISASVIDGSDYFYVTTIVPGELFRVYTIAGVIIDRETTPFIELKVKVTDGGIPPASSFSTVNVTILDVNDNPPIVTRTSFSVNEDRSVGYVLDSLSSFFYDPDLGENGTLKSFRQLSTNDYFTIQQNGDITIKNSLDKEMVNEVNVTIEITDDGIPSLSSTCIINIKITDVNDMAPVFTSNMFFSIEEEKPPMIIGQITATDEDEGINSEVEYHLENTTYFNITSDTGILSSLKKLDREVQSEYTVVVVATDKGEPPLSSSANITIYLIDINDNPPRFNQIRYNFSVPYDTSMIMIGNVTAIDPDNGTNAIVSYVLSNTTYFNVTQDGTIKSNDLSHISSFPFVSRLSVTCYDLNNSSLNDTALLEITLLNSSISAIQIVIYLAPVVFLLLIGIIFLVILICCVCMCRKHRKSFNFTTPVPPTTAAPLKPSLRSMPSSPRYEDAPVNPFKGPSKSPTVNFSEESEIRFYSQSQPLKDSEPSTFKVQTEEIEMKPSKEQVIESGSSSSKMGGVETKMSPCLSDDLSSSPSITNSHELPPDRYYNHQPNQPVVPVLREELLKRHDREYSDAPANRFPTAIIDQPDHVDDEELFNNNLPPIIQDYLRASNQSIPVSHYVSQTGSPPSERSSPSIRYPRASNHSSLVSNNNYYPHGAHHRPHLHPPPPPPHPHPHNNPRIPRNIYTEHYPTYDHQMPPHLNGTALVPRHTSSDFQPAPSPYMLYRTSSRDRHVLHNGHTSDSTEEYFLGSHYTDSHASSHSDDYHHGMLVKNRPLGSAPRTPMLIPPSPNQYGGAYAYGTDDEDDDTVASSVLDQYLQFVPPTLKHDFLSLSVDDIKLSSYDTENKRLRQEDRYNS